MAENTKKAEKTAKQKKKLNPKIKKLIMVVFAVIAIIIILFCTVLMFFRVRTVKIIINDELPYSNEELSQAASAAKGKLIFTLKPEFVSENIESKYPFANHIKIVKKLPWTIEVSVEKTVEFYAIEVNKGLYALTSDTLRVTQLTGLISKDVTLIEGLTAAKTPIEGQKIEFNNDKNISEVLTEIAESVKEKDLMPINVINCNNMGSIYMIYDGRIIIRLGNDTSISKKISLAAKSMTEENQLSPAQFGSLDVSNESRAVFGPKNYKDIPELIEYDELMENMTEEKTESDDSEAPESESEEAEEETTSAPS